MNCNPYVALVRKARKPYNAHRKLANRLDNHERYKRNYQGLIHLLLVIELAEVNR